MSKRIRTPNPCFNVVFLFRALQKSNIQLKRPGVVITRSKSIVCDPARGGADDSPGQEQAGPRPTPCPPPPAGCQVAAAAEVGASHPLQ